MKYIQMKTMQSIAWKTLVVLWMGLLLGCETDETQTVATFTNLVLDENFDTEGAPDDQLWSFDIGNGPKGDGRCSTAIPGFPNR
ncbi:MAG: hypothetical protein AAFY00_11510, partial [Bacteroidota bacterium]